VLVEPLERFDIADFRLDTRDGATLVRDSHKRNFDASCNQEVTQ
jgi:hypothetical protein